MKDCESQIKIMENLINQIKIVKNKLEEEENSFLLQLNKTSENLIHQIKLRQEKISLDIKNIFNDKLKLLNRKFNTFTLIVNRYNYYRSFICDKDIDVLDRIKQVKNLNKKIHKIEEKEKIIWSNIINTNNADLQVESLKFSIFVDDPTNSVKKALNKYQFLPLTENSLLTLKNIFAKSALITPDLIISELLITLPIIKTGCLLYKVSRDGPSPNTFHEMCDNKGPTLIIIKTDDGHVFGGYNPVSWISEYMYNEREDAFLFSITDGQYRKPIRCAIKKALKKFAIKQNEIEYSPGFGETDNADLFIAFKNLKNRIH